MATQYNDTDPTKERLLVEAERLFANKGFEAVSVREITAAAETNTAAINYHFGSKWNLYMEVFRQRWIPRATQNFHLFQQLQQKSDVTVEEIIGVFIRCFMDGPLSDHAERTTHARLIHKELDTPTEAYDLIVKEVIVPFYEVLIELVQRAMPGTSRQEAMFKCMSVFGQMVYFSHVLPIMEALMGPEFLDGLIEKSIRHIAEFSIHGFNVDGGRS